MPPKLRKLLQVIKWYSARYNKCRGIGQVPDDTVPSITSVKAQDKFQKNSMRYYWPKHNLKQNFYFQVVGNFMLGKFRQILNLYLKVYNILIDQKYKICSENKSCFLKAK